MEKFTSRYIVAEMGITRCEGRGPKRKSDYVTVDGRVLQDPTLSFRAKGLYVMIGDLPKGSFTINDLLPYTKEGPEAIGAALKDLADAGYIENAADPEGGL